jgi:hypothetical protein
MKKKELTKMKRRVKTLQNRLGKSATTGRAGGMRKAPKRGH